MHATTSRVQVEQVEACLLDRGGGNVSKVRKRGSVKTFEVRSGEKVVSLKEASTAHEALISYLRSLGCRDGEMMKLGRDRIAWRGAVYRAVRR
jgi:hypothetical protein